MHIFSYVCIFIFIYNYRFNRHIYTQVQQQVQQQLDAHLQPRISSATRPEEKATADHATTTNPAHTHVTTTPNDAHPGVDTVDDSHAGVDTGDDAHAVVAITNNGRARKDIDYGTPLVTDANDTPNDAHTAASPYKGKAAKDIDTVDLAICSANLPTILSQPPSPQL